MNDKSGSKDVLSHTVQGSGDVLGVMRSLFGECPFIHENIDTLYHVPPTPIEDLPRQCTCGAALTYADTVAFVNVKEEEA